MRLFVYWGRRSAVVEFPEKKADGSMFARSLNGALYLVPGTFELTDDEAGWIEKHRPELWATIEERTRPTKKQPAKAKPSEKKPEPKPAAIVEDKVDALDEKPKDLKPKLYSSKSPRKRGR